MGAESKTRSRGKQPKHEPRLKIKTQGWSAGVSGVVISVGKAAVLSISSAGRGRVVNVAKWKLYSAPPIVRGAVWGLFVRWGNLMYLATNRAESEGSQVPKEVNSSRQVG